MDRHLTPGAPGGIVASWESSKSSPWTDVSWCMVPGAGGVGWVEVGVVGVGCGLCDRNSWTRKTCLLDKCWTVDDLWGCEILVRMGL